MNTIEKLLDAIGDGDVVTFGRIETRRVLRRGRPHQDASLVVERCPFCGRKHHHGQAGHEAGHVTARVSHCHDGRGSPYVIVVLPADEENIGQVYDTPDGPTRWRAVAMLRNGEVSYADAVVLLKDELAELPMLPPVEAVAKLLELVRKVERREKGLHGDNGAHTM